MWTAPVVPHLEGELAVSEPHAAHFHAAGLTEGDGIEVDAAGGSVGHDPERGLQQVKRGARTPGLRIARHEVLRRAIVVAGVPPETAEKLGEAVVGHSDTGLHDA